jgi:hypothetical protein
MGIERLALFALSIAFTASVVALPSLPSDIPPRAGLDGPFVGAPLVAFLLPVAAIAIWRLLETLAHPPATMRTRKMHSDAAVAMRSSTSDGRRFRSWGMRNVVSACWSRLIAASHRPLTALFSNTLKMAVL